MGFQVPANALRLQSFFLLKTIQWYCVVALLPKIFLLFLHNYAALLILIKDEGTLKPSQKG
jgi:hypothetical protein